MKQKHNTSYGYLLSIPDPRDPSAGEPMVPKLLFPQPAASVLARDENPLPTPAAEPAAATAAAAADCRPAHTPTNIPFHDHKPDPSTVVSQTYGTEITAFVHATEKYTTQQTGEHITCLESYL